MLTSVHRNIGVIANSKSRLALRSFSNVCGERIGPFALIPGTKSHGFGLGHMFILELITWPRYSKYTGSGQVPICAAKGIEAAFPKPPFGRRVIPQGKIEVLLSE